MEKEKTTIPSDSEEYGMGSVGSPKKYVPNKVKETDINNVVEID